MKPKLLMSIAAFASIAFLASPRAAAGAELLVHMANGKVVRADSVELEGSWLLVTLEGGHVIGVLASTVDRVEDDLFPESQELGDELNVVTSGRFIPRGRSSLGSRSSSRRSSPPTATTKPPAETKEEEKPASPLQGGLRIQDPQPSAKQRLDNRRSRDR